MHEQRDVVGALAQRRQVHREHVDAVVEVLAEAAARDELIEIAVGRGDDADVDATILIVADPAELLRLQDAQELGLQRQRQLADLVEEQRAGVRGREQTLAIARRVGERAAHVTEQLVLEQRLGDRGAVDDDERRVVARRRVVDRARDQLLAGAALAEDRDGHVGRRDHRDPVVELLDPRPRADHDVALARPALVDALAAPVARAPDPERELGGDERPRDHVGRAARVASAMPSTPAAISTTRTPPPCVTQLAHELRRRRRIGVEQHHVERLARRDRRAASCATAASRVAHATSLASSPSSSATTSRVGDVSSTTSTRGAIAAIVPAVGRASFERLDAIRPRRRGYQSFVRISFARPLARRRAPSRCSRREKFSRSSSLPSVGVFGRPAAACACDCGAALPSFWPCGLLALALLSPADPAVRALALPLPAGLAAAAGLAPALVALLPAGPDLGPGPALALLALPCPCWPC